MGGKASKERQAKEREAKSRELAVYKEKLEVLAEAQKERESRERIVKQIADVKREEMKLQAEIEKERIKANKVIEKEKIEGQTVVYGMNHRFGNFLHRNENNLSCMRECLGVLCHVWRKDSVYNDRRNFL